jgi:hypothetical protein
MPGVMARIAPCVVRHAANDIVFPDCCSRSGPAVQEGKLARSHARRTHNIAFGLRVNSAESLIGVTSVENSEPHTWARSSVCLCVGLIILLVNPSYVDHSKSSLVQFILPICKESKKEYCA